MTVKTIAFILGIALSSTSLLNAQDYTLSHLTTDTSLAILDDSALTRPRGDWPSSLELSRVGECRRHCRDRSKRQVHARCQSRSKSRSVACFRRASHHRWDNNGPVSIGSTQQAQAACG